MPINEKVIPIPGRLHNVAVNGHVAGADEIIDDTLGLTQDVINSLKADKSELPTKLSDLLDDYGIDDIKSDINSIAPGKYYERQYLTFEALESGTISFIGNGTDDYGGFWITPNERESIAFSLDNGDTWTTVLNEDYFKNIIVEISVNSGDKILWKGIGKSNYKSGPTIVYCYFSSSCDFIAYGNIMSLLYGDNFFGQVEFPTNSNKNLSNIFSNCQKLKNITNLCLPATTLATSCYNSMFQGCTSLTTAPELPATTLATSCYNSMFQGCTSLTTAPELLATTLATSCYNSMFQGCTSLTTASLLNATTLADSCCRNMFRDCTSLTTTLKLPATTLANNCYNYMFYGCTSLTTVPVLPATTLANYCYDSMFSGCTSLTTAPKLPVTTLAQGCYSHMFQGCTSLTTAPELPATTLIKNCYSNMFNGCTNLSSIKCLATNINVTNCTNSWVDSVAASGTFIKAASMSNWTEGTSGIPSGWTVYDSDKYSIGTVDKEKTKKVVVSSNLTNLTTSIAPGESEIVVYVNSGNTTDYTIAISSTYETPYGDALELTCPKDGYCGVKYVNIDGTIYANALSDPKLSDLEEELETEQRVVASALNDLKNTKADIDVLDRVLNLENINSDSRISTLENANLNSRIATIENKNLDSRVTELEDETEVVAAALNDLNDRKLDSCINITYFALKTKRDDGELIPGQWYRITDYECTTTLENSQSAGNIFDIIVRADSSSVLNENAYAALHEDDTYFKDCKLEAWELKYSIDNDTSRFLWADTEDGKGVIYWMRDEWGNECPYDFKNIQFLRYRIDTCENVPGLEGLFAMDGASGITVDTETEYWCYTFSMIDTSNNEAHDVTVEQNKYWGDEGYVPKNRNNVFKPYYTENYDDGIQLMALPNNVMVTDTDICSIKDDYGEFYGYYNNSFGNNCYNNTIGNYFRRNTIGNDFNYNTIGNECYGNTIGNDFNYNTIGNSFYQNSIGNECYGNTIGNSFQDNSIGNGFNNNTIGNNCYYNSIGNSFGYNTIGNNCYNNSIGNYFQNNSIGNYFQNNSIGESFYQNSIGNWFYYNSIGNGCNHINIQKAYVYYIIIENGNQYINITSTQTTSDSNKLCNFTVSQGINNSTTVKTISHNTVNDTFQTVYQPTGSTTVNV